MRVGVGLREEDVSVGDSAPYFALGREAGVSAIVILNGAENLRPEFLLKPKTCQCSGLAVAEPTRRRRR